MHDTHNPVQDMAVTLMVAFDTALDQGDYSYEELVNGSAFQTELQMRLDDPDTREQYPNLEVAAKAVEVVCRYLNDIRDNPEYVGRKHSGQ